MVSGSVKIGGVDVRDFDLSYLRSNVGVVTQETYLFNGTIRENLFLKDPKILILDEATSALDSISENAIQQALDLLMEGRTSIVIAHRLSTILKADSILVVKDGVIAEQGSHDSLLKLGGIYKELYETQFRQILEMEGKGVEGTDYWGIVEEEYLGF